MAVLMIITLVLAIGVLGFAFAYSQISIKKYKDIGSDIRKHLLILHVIGGMMMVAFIVSAVILIIHRDNTLGIIPAVAMLIISLFGLYACFIIRGYMKRMDEMRSKFELYEDIKNNFIDSMSYEIRNPMNVIIGMTDILMKKYIGREDSENLMKIKNSGIKLLDTINDVLDFTRLETGELELTEEKYSLADFIKGIEDYVAPSIKDKNVELLLEVDPAIPNELIGDAFRIRQILVGLLANAVKYTRVGIIILKFSCVQGREKIKLNISVEDTGCGMKKEQLDNIKTYIERDALHQQYLSDGLGLGLPIASKLIDLMDGEIGIKSDFGDGTVVSISIPQKVSSLKPIGVYHEHHAETVYEPQSFKAAMARILVVDDSIVNLFVERQMFEKYGLDVVTAESGQECLNLMATGTFDMVFLDHMMPVMDGIETLRQIRARDGEYYKKVPIIALTANVITGAKQLFINEGFQGYVSKPVDADVLENVLKEFLPSDKVCSLESSFTPVEISEDKIEEKVWYKRLLKYLEGIDVREGLRRAGDDYTSYMNVLRVIYADGANVCSKIRGYAESSNLESYMIEVHAIKSSTASIGAGKLSFMAAEHESAAAQSNYEYIQNHVGTLLSEYESLLLSIERLIEYENSSMEQSIIVDTKITDICEVKPLLKELCDALDDFDADAAESILKEIHKNRYDAETERTLKNIDTLLLSFRYDEAVRIVRENLGKGL